MSKLTYVLAGKDHAGSFSVERINPMAQYKVIAGIIGKRELTIEVNDKTSMPSFLTWETPIPAEVWDEVSGQLEDPFIIFSMTKILEKT